MSDYVIETDGLTKRFGEVLAVDCLSLRVPRGQVFGLLGPNGSGKSTTIGMLLGLVAPSSGTFRLMGTEMPGPHQKALHRIGAIVESPAFYPYLSGRANLAYFQGLSRRGSPEDVDQLLEKVGLAQRAHSKFSTYSMGMKQRLGIAYALMGDPELIILDEPTNGLDPAGMAEVRDLIRGLGRDRHTVLLASHLLHEVELVCDSVAILSRGRLLAQGSVQGILHQQGAVRLKTTDNPRAEPILASAKWITAVIPENGYLRATVTPERSGDITKVLADQGVYVTEMSPVQMSLESYFLEVTGADALLLPKEASPSLSK
ncbi:MAG: ABC transporter ATP-binding protein [Chloroflexi bacterium]|nr:ABC transporter ATP-binding protein [Chloroflexota bacterium]